MSNLLIFYLSRDWWFRFIIDFVRTKSQRFKNKSDAQTSFVRSSLLSDDPYKEMSRCLQRGTVWPVEVSFLRVFTHTVKQKQLLPYRVDSWFICVGFFFVWQISNVLIAWKTWHLPRQFTCCAVFVVCIQCTSSEFFRHFQWGANGAWLTINSVEFDLVVLLPC